MGKIKILFWFDVEDFINPESEEALSGLLDLLDRRGISGIFKLVGEKARKLEAHGRHDILDKLKRHEVGYHTDLHSVHPVVTAYLEPFGFREGADEFARREGGGFADVAKITGQPVRCYGQPGLAWAPQPYAALRQWGVSAYLDSHPQISLGGRPFWYGGLLNLTSLSGLMGMRLKDGELEKAKRRFDQLCEAQADEAVGFISIFYHPTEFVFSQFWDAVNFSKGNNPPPDEWVKPAFRPEGHMRRFLDMVGEFVDYTLTREGVAYATTDDLIRLERSEKRALAEEEIRLLAERTRTEVSYAVHGRLSLSASELFWVFRQYVLGREPVPELIYGPQRDVPSDPAGPAGQVAVRDVLAALRGELPSVRGFKQLPDVFEVAGARVNPADMVCLLAAMIRQGAKESDRLELVKGTLAAARHSDNSGEWAKHWVIFPEDLAIPNIVRMAGLQTWTLKPAIF